MVGLGDCLGYADGHTDRMKLSKKCRLSGVEITMVMGVTIHTDRVPSR